MSPMSPTGKRHAPSTKFTRDELAALALAGVRERVRTIERELHRMQREFPSVFITDAPLVLLAAEPRDDGSTWPLVAPGPKPGQRTWTDAQRKVHARRMRKVAKAQWARRRASGEAAPKKKAGKKKAGKVPVWQRMREALLAAPDHRATIQELMEAAKATSSNVAGSATMHADTFKRVEPGVYTLTAAGMKAAENGATA